MAENGKENQNDQEHLSIETSQCNDEEVESFVDEEGNPLQEIMVQNSNGENIVLFVSDSDHNTSSSRVQDLLRVGIDQLGSTSDQADVYDHAHFDLKNDEEGIKEEEGNFQSIECSEFPSQQHQQVMSGDELTIDENQKSNSKCNNHSSLATSTEMDNLFQLAKLSSGSVVHTTGNESTHLTEGFDSQQAEQATAIENVEIESSNMVEFSFAYGGEDNEELKAKEDLDEKPALKDLGVFNVGDSFYSLESLEEALRKYEQKNCVKLYKRDVRSLDALLKRSLKLQKLDQINKSLKYGQLLYCCVYGGKRKAQKIACMDASGVARFTDCHMFIRFAISGDGMALVVNGKNEEHCHDEVVSHSVDAEEPHYDTNSGNANEIRLGAGYTDLEELYKAIYKYETDNHVHLWRRDGRTIEALAKRAPGTAKKVMETNPGLRFAELRFCCSYGGRQSTSCDSKERLCVSRYPYEKFFLALYRLHFIDDIISRIPNVYFDKIFPNSNVNVLSLAGLCKKMLKLVKFLIDQKYLISTMSCFLFPI